MLEVLIGGRALSYRHVRHHLTRTILFVKGDNILTGRECVPTPVHLEHDIAGIFYQIADNRISDGLHVHPIMTAIRIHI